MSPFLRYPGVGFRGPRGIGSLAVLDQEHMRERLADMLARLGEGPGERVESERIRSALERLDRKDFGHCVKCAGEIEAERLESVPYAVLCETCLSAAAHH